MKLIDATNDSYSEYNKDFNKNDFNKKILNLKSVIMLEFQNIKTFFLKDTLQIGHKFLLLVKLKIQLLGLMFLMI